MTCIEVSPAEWWLLPLDDVVLDAQARPTVPVVIVSGDGTPCAQEHGRRPVSTSGPVVIVTADTPGDVCASLRRRADILVVSHEPDRDAVVAEDPLAEARDLAARICASPVAALTLVGMLRCGFYRDVAPGLAAESAAYSMLLGSEEFRRWRRERPARPVDRPDTPRVRVRRDADVLRVTLANPDRRNAMEARMRDDLLGALEPALHDDSLTVVLDGLGPSFCSGGDLDEFASTPDLGRAHLIRQVASVGAVLSELGDRLEVRVHGDCFGAGIELPAFASRLLAAPGSTFTLPELSMGLIPGAGGTTSIARRIGRRRLAWFAVCGRPVGVDTALEWGLVDRVG